MKSVITIMSDITGGGAEKLASDLSIFFEKTFEHKTYLYNSLEDKYGYSGKIIYIGGERKKNSVLRIIRQIKILCKLWHIKRKTKVDVSISHMLIPNILNLTSKRNEKVICVLHGEWDAKLPDNKLLSLIIKNAYKKADVIIAVSDYMRDLYQENHGFSQLVEVINNGIPLNSIKVKSKIESTILLPDKYIVTVGALRPEKNYVQLIEKLHHFLSTTEYHLVIVGDGPERELLEKVIVRLSLAKKIVLLGNLSNPYPIILKAELLFVSSFTESFSLVIVEALALGTLVFSTACGGPNEILNPLNETFTKIYYGDFGVLISSLNDFDSTSFTESILLLLNDRQRKERTISNGFNRAKDYDIIQKASQYQDIITKTHKD